MMHITQRSGASGGNSSASGQGLPRTNIVHIHFKKITRGSILVLAFLLASVGHAQIRSATITGVIHDATGALVPSAMVTITDQETGVGNTFTTTSTGQYTF